MSYVHDAAGNAGSFGGRPDVAGLRVQDSFGFGPRLVVCRAFGERHLKAAMKRRAFCCCILGCCHGPLQIV